MNDNPTLAADTFTALGWASGMGGADHLRVGLAGPART